MPKVQEFYWKLLCGVIWAKKFCRLPVAQQFYRVYSKYFSSKDGSASQPRIKKIGPYAYSEWPLFVLCLYVICFCFILLDVKAENGPEPRLPDPGTQLSIDIALGRKRKIETAPNEDSDDESALAPPSNDIYRQRQQKKVKWQIGDCSLIIATVSSRPVSTVARVSKWAEWSIDLTALVTIFVNSLFRMWPQHDVEVDRQCCNRLLQVF